MPIKTRPPICAVMKQDPIVDLPKSKLVLEIPLANPFKYRADIDGIRAIAVSAVVLFHAFPESFRGGFIGVDVFFVISGYLISSIIIKDLNNGSFNYLRFYSNRVRRIFPALFVVLTACAVFGWFTLFTNEFASLGKHIAASAAFVENIQLWRESGYFNTDSNFKLLLHLWSLGIEEQFYILWPLLLTVFYRRKRYVLPAIVILLACSFVLNISQINTYPTATFYLPFSRFWELLFGCLLAYSLFYKSDLSTVCGGPSALILSIVSAGGLVLISAGMILLDSRRAFPGWWAILPVAGTFLLIAAGSGAVVNRKILSHPALVYVGLISYPIYLWHWPLLTFARIMIPEGPSIVLRAGLIVSAFMLAELTYRVAEKPVRFKKGVFVTTALVAVMSGVAIFGLVMRISNGFESFGDRKNILVSDIESSLSPADYKRCAESLSDTSPSLNYCMQSSAAPPTAAIFGDSHADHLFPGVARADPGRSWLLIGNSACPPVSGIDVEGEIRNCESRSEKALKFLQEDNAIDTVVLSFFANFFLDTDYAAGHLARSDGPSAIKITSHRVPDYSKASMAYYGLDAAIAELERAGKRVVLIIDVPELPFEPLSCIKRPLTGEATIRDCSISKQSVLDRQSEFRRIVAKLQLSYPLLEVYDSLDALCKGDRCWVESEGVMRYRDSHHLSLRGSDVLGRAFISWFLHPRL
jgi:peptidoglycan/LPS O-acetylase OafA/YrhL